MKALKAKAGTRTASLLVAIPVLMMVAGPAAADCTKLDTTLRGAVKDSKVDVFKDLHAKMLADPSCDGSYRQRVGRVLALATLRHVSTAAKKDSGKIPIESLQMAAGFGEPWQVMAVLGDAYYAKELWVAAVRAYEAALDDMRNERANPKPPPKRIEHRVVKRAYQARALAPVYVATRRFRGRPSGAASPKFRNFSVETVPVPVKFRYNESVLTPQGEKAAADILEYVNDQQAKVVRLFGHTDPRGSDGYNLNLSRSRAAAVMRYLLDNGFQGQVEVVGKGERSRFQPDDALKYTQEQLFEFDRRVEYQVVQ